MPQDMEAPLNAEVKPGYLNTAPDLSLLTQPYIINAEKTYPAINRLLAD